jgi:Holliday junction DNA helicase RuvB
MSGPAIDRKADMAAILTALEPADVLFIDEIHRLNRAIEELLYPAMEDGCIDIVIGQGPGAHSLRLELKPFTLVGATTRTGLLTTPLRDRFGITHRLDYYTEADLVQIVRRSARILDVRVDDEACNEIARRSRGTPRVANRILRRVRDFAQVRHSGEVSHEIALEALELFEVDGIGLERMDREILRAIAVTFGGGPVGLSTLAVAIGEQPDTLEDVYEPYLLQRGLMQRTPRGRVVTRAAFEHLGLPPPARDPRLF